MVGGFISYWTNMSEFDLNAESFLGGKIIELVVDVVCISHVSFQTENSEALKVFWLMNHSVKIVRVVQNTGSASISHLVRILLSWVLGASRSLSCEVGRLVNLWTIKDFCLNCVGL